MKVLIILTSIVLSLFLSGCTIVIGNPQATTTPSQTEATTEQVTTQPPTEVSTVITTTTVPTTKATQPPAPTTKITQPPAPTNLPIDKKTVAKTYPPKTQAPKTKPPKPQANKTISAQKAKNIALSHAGVSEANARGLRANLDYDDGRVEYEVEFYANGFEYDYEIDGNSGRVISYDKDMD